MSEDLNEKIDEAIAKMADNVKALQGDSQKTLHCSQAALNLAHTKAILQGDRAPKATTKKAD